LLGLANSAYFGLAEPVNSISEAISRVLGVDTVRSLVLAMAIQQSFNSRDCGSFDVEKFWIDSLMTAECCKRIVAADDISDDAVRDLAYCAGLCHNLGLMALAHMEAIRTHIVLTKNDKLRKSGALEKLLDEEFGTDHRIMTAELGRAWSLPTQMVSAYQYLAFPEVHCEGRLGLIVAAAIAAVDNAERPVDQRSDITSLAESLSMGADEISEMAVFGERQLERVSSLASNMTR
jgi:HD-like signal output (HDOD) protein